MRLRDCQDIVDAADVGTLESLLVRLANELGFGIISGALIVAKRGDHASSVPFGNIPEAYRPISASVERGKRDPVMHRLKQLSVPFVYDQSTYVNEEAADIWEVQAAYGYKTGIAMSLHLPDHRHVIIGVDRDRPLPHDELLLTRTIANFQMLAVYAHAAVLRLLGPRDNECPPQTPLTGRQLEILKWTAEGKSAWTVGQILGVSEHNVNYHIHKILAALSVASKHQAAAIARSRGLI